ncbi:MAG: CRISPR system precrRNA processing endoribonuclease RAMP protein Cas6 [Armatimonadota bacterium]
MIESLSFARYHFNLQCLSDIVFRGFSGSTLRGAFGSVFRRLVCITRAPTCEGCVLRQQCAYGYVFETAPPSHSQRLRRYESVPRPYVLSLPDSTRLAFHEGEPLQMTLTLIGRAIDYFPYFVFTSQRLEETGLGVGRHEGKGRFRLTEVLAERADGNTVRVFTPKEGIDTLRLPVLRGADILERIAGWEPRRLGVQFVTPARLRFEGRLTDQIEFHHLVRALLHRLSSLLYFHCGAEPDTDYAGLIARAQEVRTVQRRLRWVEQDRYSSRQKSLLQMGGFTGEMVFEGHLEPFLPLLAVGEYVHIGKGTVMGLGKIRLVREEEKRCMTGS